MQAASFGQGRALWATLNPTNHSSALRLRHRRACSSISGVTNSRWSDDVFSARVRTRLPCCNLCSPSTPFPESFRVCRMNDCNAECCSARETADCASCASPQHRMEARSTRVAMRGCAERGARSAERGERKPCASDSLLVAVHREHAPSNTSTRTVPCWVVPTYT